MFSKLREHVRFFSQNLDLRPGDFFLDATGSKIMHGRAHIATDEICLGVEWHLRSPHCSISSEMNSEDREATLGLAIPPAAVYFKISGLPKRLFELLGIDWESVKDLPDGSSLTRRETHVSIHNWALGWSLWMPSHMSKSDDPRWRRGSLSLLDTVFGETSFSEKQVDKQAVLVPMPERNYRGTVTLLQQTWKRPRWPFKTGPERLHLSRLGYRLTMEEGEQIPFPGKGENSWDQGENALYDLSGRGDVIDAIAAAVRTIYKSRRAYGGSVSWRPDPPRPAVNA